MTSQELFQHLNGQVDGGFPAIHVPVFKSARGTPYLTAAGVVLIAKPHLHLSGLKSFLEGFDPALGFANYLEDPTTLPDGTQLCKIAGQTCYASFGAKRTMNQDANRYFQNLMASGHGSVLEHANYSFLFYGISRSLTHELVRHRAGFGFSQLSQRYVSGRVLRFVERPEFQDGGKFHHMFLERIDRAYAEYHKLADLLLAEQEKGAPILSAEVKTDLRKKVNQAARGLLPNETETIMVVTGNVRAWRHVLEMRASEHSELEIRSLAIRVFLCLRQIEPILFGDYQLHVLADGTYAVSTPNRKV
ncbi:MAG: FAD-dependent thymidylate synthase [candidate division KSB1 bacterium]|nr:FAD-dependent thymidylate synthase [candidate division KSB1 bacterium]MDZ7301057.1 FAD-dependent thymidylate synthase [candidate division KSB1 bacterium]MDZ7312119.1 FAD-dependent thymidylate synthase [candidate division KSB1 bacterium]